MQSNGDPGDMPRSPARAAMTVPSRDEDAVGHAASKGEVNRCNATALRKAARNVFQLYDSILAPSGLRSTQRSILMHVSRLESPSMGELAASLVLNKFALTHNLKPLLRDGLVRLVRDQSDGRRRRVVITGLGEERLRQSWRDWRSAQDKFEAAFGVDEAKRLRDALAVIASFRFVPGKGVEIDGT